MNKLIFSFFSLTVLGFLYYLVQGDGTKWQLKKSEKNVAVYVRDIPGKRFLESQAVTSISTNLPSLVAVFNDVPVYTEWVYDCKEVKLLKQINEKKRYVHIVFDAPWPAKNRDVVIKFTLTQDPLNKTVNIKMEDTPGFIPEIDGLVRIAELNGNWEIIPTTSGTMMVNYRIYVDPGGFVPAWLANSKAVDNPFNTILGLKEMVKDEKYQTADFDYIEELTKINVP